MASHEDVPPPPYSETDIYSASGRDAHVADDAASRSTSSSNGDIIYTPPLSPRSSQNSNFAGEVDHTASSAAAAYFETRPAPRLSSPRPRISHSIIIRPNTTPDSLPYPSVLSSRDVRLEDWQTFVNYLLPHHSATVNEQVINRKLRAETMTAINSTNGNNDEDARSQSSARSHAEAQLNQIRNPIDADPAQRRQTINATVHEWNDGFFGPRRVTIHVEVEPVTATTNNNSGLNEVPPLPEKQPMPGAWDQSFDHQQAAPEGERGAAAGDSPASPRSRFPFFGGAGGPRGGHGPGNGSGGFRFGGINIENDRVSIGNILEADGRTGSLRVGGIVADSNGIRINGRPMFGGGRGGPSRGPCGPPGPGMGFGRGAGGPWGHRGRGPMGSRWWHDRGGWGRSNWCHPGDAGDHGHGRGRGRDEHRFPHPGDRHRSRSSSVSSCSSLSSSAHSESSIGSLPDYDDLRDSQLPVAKQYLQEWLHRPDQNITKEQVKNLKEQIKAAKHSNDPATMAQDKAALRREVKELLREWKALKKQQKRTRKQLRRERKEQRRREKRERRQARREARRAERDATRGRHHGHGHGHGGPFHPFGMPPLPPMPPMPPMPHGSHMPPMPPMPSMPPMPPIFGHRGPAQPPHDDGQPGAGPTINNPFSHFPWGGHNRTPGAWPADDTSPPYEHTEGVAYADTYTGYHAKYQAAEDVGAKLAEKEAELLKLHERIAEEQAVANAGQYGGSSSKGDGSEKEKHEPSKMEAEAQAVQREIAELVRKMEKLRTEADEDFARELVEEEQRQARV